MKQRTAPPPSGPGDAGEGPTEFDVGFLLGVLVGEGHFGGDGRQPHVVLRMHTDHRALFEWLVATFPGGRLYGPYDHGGRKYYQWMARGEFLRDVLAPLLDRYLTPGLDGKSHARYLAMKERYARQLTPRAARTPPFGTDAAARKTDGEEGEVGDVGA